MQNLKVMVMSGDGKQMSKILSCGCEAWTLDMLFPTGQRKDVTLFIPFLYTFVSFFLLSDVSSDKTGELI